ncbi:acyltransferase family protein [Granulicella arctica]|uniref:Peptidoglycan/LPS O-acetylase OafA/YrhL n=1 Tax=Granulicella arctica TaxID=940613 RepID=A0A7Y9PGT4_9BACT|nr:acyltransferase [Granulicella arctica]NYF79612.1 peptidoglycan/LPS O-acetylase OafA/YrhL [Granulicella arctica]
MSLSTEVINEVAPSRASVTNRFYQPELDGLRFYAFLGVFVCHTLPFETSFYRSFHLPLPWLWGAVVKAGAAGVDLFFALSAFLITSLLLKERLETGGISLKLFYARRVLRIWPLYFLVIALGIVLSHTMSNQNLPWFYVAGYLLFVGNWVHAVFGRPESIAFPLWTVSIEEQFYLIWPLLVKKFERRGLIISGIVMFLLATACRVGLVLAGVSGGYIYYGSTARCDSIALGSLMALFADRLPRLTSGTRLLLVGGGLMGWIVSSAWLTDQPGPISMREVSGRLIISLAAGAILYGCLYSRTKLLTGPWFVSLGKVSYGLYLLHLVGLLIAKSLIHPISGMALLGTKAIGFVVTLILAFASYRWVESPFLRLKDRFARVLSRPV